MDNKNEYNFRKEVSQATMRILRQKTKQSIAAKLDARKLLLTDTRLHRDWRGLAELANLDASVIRSSKISYTEHCFHLWIQKGAIIQDFWNALESIDRYDVIDDSLEMIYSDYDYALSKDVLGLRLMSPPLEDVQASITDFDSNVLTTDDQKNITDGGTLQFYDALVLFADEDLDFVDEMIQKLEGEYNLKLCLKDRDLVGGLAFEFSAVMRLIEERCARVIVVLSPDFLQSSANKFLTQFAHSLSIDRKKRIVIPCMYKPCQKPSEITYCHSLDYFRTKGYWDYWKKLADSIVYKHPGNSSNAGPTLREITYPSSPSSRVMSSSNSASSSPSNHSRSPPTSTLPSLGILSRIRRRTGEKTEKRQSRESPPEPLSLPSSSHTTTSFKNVTCETELSVSLPSIPADVDDMDGVSNCSYSSNTSSSRLSPTSPTFSTAPLLPSGSQQHEGGLRSMFKRVMKIKKKREVAV